MIALKFAISALLLLLGAAMLAYCAYMVLYSMWLSAHPHFDDQVWFTRAMLWLIAAVGIGVVELLGVRWLLKAGRRRVPQPSAESPGCNHDQCEPSAY
ncbi:MAG: hypothetical protein KJZ69_05865 [Phycisphaerales bacterium]|nr:hypothetical protein [Phycisphaerales bacterium]